MPALLSALLLLSSGGLQDPEKLLLGFEKEELLRTESTLREEVREAGWFYLLDRPEGVDFAARFEAPGEINRAWTWRCRSGARTQGELSLVVRVGPANPKGLEPTYRRTDFLSHFYPSVYASMETRHLMSTFQWLSKGRRDLRDWSGYGRLRADVRCDDASAELRWAVEDDVIEPPVVTTYRVPKGRWVTLELDLERAVEARGLDLRRMANFWFLGVADRAADLRIDNVRLARPDAPASHPVLRDDRDLAVNYAAPSAPVLPDRGALPEPVRKAVDREPARDVAEGSMAPFGWATAWDNDHLFVAFGVKKGARAFQSRDGGRTWSELERPTVAVLDHQTARGGALDPWGDGLAVSSGPGCGGYAGLGKAGPRQHVTKYTFTAGGWKERVPDILDADIRHCGSNASVTRILRGPHRGRLWASWGAIDRNHEMGVHVKVSDDDGRTWIPWSRGAELPGAGRGWTNGTYGYAATEIVPLGDHVAVFWRHRGAKGLFWSRFDGRSWSAPEVVVDEALRMDGAYYETMTAVSTEKGEVFLSTIGLGTVFRWDGRAWHREPVKVEDGQLALCGDVLAVFGSGNVERRWKGRGWTRPAVLRVHWRLADGTWKGPEVLVPEFKMHEYRSIPGFAVPRHAPPNFVPLAWSDAGDGKVKLMRVPVPGDGR